MKTKFILWSATALTFLCAVAALGQPNCNALVALDAGNVLTNTAQITTAASGLIDQGADVHVLSVDEPKLNSGLSMQQMETIIELQCPSWRVDGHRKPNLFVLMVSPKQRKKNAFFGAAYSPVLQNEDTVNSIYSASANPYFKQGDFAGGMTAALRDFGAKVAAFHDQQKHPVQSTTVVQATDMNGFWIVCAWALALCGIGVAFYWLGRWMRARRTEREEIEEARINARAAKARATRVYQRSSQYRHADLVGTVPSTDISSRYLELSNSVSNDPDTDGLTALAYNGIRLAWQDFYDSLTPVASRFAAANQPAPPRSPRQSKTHDNRPFNPFTAVSQAKASRRDQVGTPNTAPAPVVTTTVNTGGNDMLTGLIVGEELGRSRDYEAPARYRAPDPEPDRSSSGSDSSWGSSDSGSSGSDSSYSSDSGSSDFGGGGSDSGF
jgi:uncharacterized membrane protein YgcG